MTFGQPCEGTDSGTQVFEESFSTETAARLDHDTGASHLGRGGGAEEAEVEAKGQSLNSGNPRECTGLMVRLWRCGRLSPLSRIRSYPGCHFKTLLDPR